jgi:SAM-dependent methyltransferase
VHIVQSDLLRPPFRPEAFDYVWSAGVLHHMLETESGFGSIANLVKPGGRIYIWIYSNRVFTLTRFTRNSVFQSLRDRRNDRAFSASEGNRQER